MSDIIFLGCFQAFIFLSCFAVCYYKKQNPRLVLIFNLYKTLSLRHLATGFYRIIHKISIQYTYIPVIKLNIRHGHGVQSVRKVVEKYNGTVSFTDKGDIFEVSAMLYGIEVKE